MNRARAGQSIFPARSRQSGRCSRRDSNSYILVVVLHALPSTAVPDAVLPPPSLESYLPTSDRQGWPLSHVLCFAAPARPGAMVEMHRLVGNKPSHVGRLFFRVS